MMPHLQGAAYALKHGRPLQQQQQLGQQEQQPKHKQTPQETLRLHGRLQQQQQQHTQQQVKLLLPHQPPALPRL
jgi:hypothetical protein